MELDAAALFFQEINDEMRFSQRVSENREPRKLRNKRTNAVENEEARASAREYTTLHYSAGLDFRLF